MLVSLSVKFRLQFTPLTVNGTPLQVVFVVDLRALLSQWTDEQAKVAVHVGSAHNVIEASPVITSGEMLVQSRVIFVPGPA